MKVVYLSPSNQTANMYSFGGISEYENMNAIAELIKSHLVNTYKDVSVYIAPKSMSIYGARELDAQAKKANCYIALHSNAGGGKGCKAWYSSVLSGSWTLTNNIYNAICGISSSRGQGLAQDYFSEVTKNSIPPAYIEIEYHDNVTCAKWLIDNRSKISKAVGDGIAKYLKLVAKPVPIKPTPIAVGSKVKFLSTARTWATGQSIPLWVKLYPFSYTVKEINKDKVLIKERFSWAWLKDLKKV